MNEFLIIPLIWNIIVMLIYGVDKILARMHKRRISEMTLLLSAFLMGGCGAILGMVLFNHKTSKIKFRILVPLAFVAEVVAVYFIVKK